MEGNHEYKETKRLQSCGLQLRALMRKKEVVSHGSCPQDELCLALGQQCMPALQAAGRVTRTPCSLWSAPNMVSASLNSTMAPAGGVRSVASWRMKTSPSDKGILLRIKASLPTGRNSQASDEVTERTPPHSLFYRKTGGAMASVCISEPWKPTALGLCFLPPIWPKALLLAVERVEAEWDAEHLCLPSAEAVLDV